MRNPSNRFVTPTLFLFCCALLVCVPQEASAQSVPLAQHVVLVIEENTSFSKVFPSGMSWLSGQGKKYGYANNFYSNVSGSLLDYLYLASGSCESNYKCGGAPVCSLPSGSHNFNCNGNVCNTVNNCVTSSTKNPITDENIFHLMNNQPISLKGYAH